MYRGPPEMHGLHAINYGMFPIIISVQMETRGHDKHAGLCMERIGWRVTELCCLDRIYIDVVCRILE